jgi:hypothetical protein
MECLSRACKAEHNRDAFANQQPDRRYPQINSGNLSSAEVFTVHL